MAFVHARPGTSCYSCLETLAAGQPHVTLEACSHCFHERCLQTWLADHPEGTCPVCYTADDAASPTGCAEEAQPEPQQPSLWRRMVTLLFTVAQVGGVHDPRQPERPPPNDEDWRDRLAALYANWGTSAEESGDEQEGVTGQVSS